MNSSSTRRVLVCQHRTCTKDGAAEVLATFRQQEIENVNVESCGCLGLCGSGPMVLVLPDNVYYWHISPNKVQIIIETHLISGIEVQSIMHPRLHPNVGDRNK